MSIVRIILPKLENENDIQISKNSLIFQNKNQTNIYELEIEWVRLYIQ